jgi:hypothetical protein
VCRAVFDWSETGQNLCKNRGFMRTVSVPGGNGAVLIDPVRRVGNIRGAREATAMNLDIPLEDPHFQSKVCVGGDIVRGSDLADPGRRIRALWSSQAGCVDGHRKAPLKGKAWVRQARLRRGQAPVLKRCRQ